jgi:hypothetical protein
MALCPDRAQERVPWPCSMRTGIKIVFAPFGAGKLTAERFNNSSWMEYRA